MTPHQILIVLIRLVAFVWLFYAIANVGALYGLMLQEGAPFSSVPIWSMPLLQFVGVALLWLFPATIASRLLRGIDREIASTYPQPAEWETLAMVSIGIWVLAGGVIPDLMYWIVRWVKQGGESNDYVVPFNSEDHASIIATLGQLIVALWLVFGARGFAAFLLKARKAGLNVGR